LRRRRRRQGAEAKPAREFRTGSNIPVKDPAPPLSDAEREKTVEKLRELQRTSVPPTKAR